MNIGIVSQQEFYPSLVGDTVVAYNWAKKLAETNTVFSFYYSRSNNFEYSDNSKIQKISYESYCVNTRKKSKRQKLYDILRGYVPGTFADRSNRLCDLINISHERYQIDAIIFVGARFVDFPVKKLPSEIHSTICIPDSVRAKISERRSRVGNSKFIYNVQSYIKQFIWYRAEKQLPSKWEKVFTVSETEKERLNKNWPELVEPPLVVPNGVDETLSQARSSSDSPRLTYHGSNPGGRSEDLIEFLSNVYPKIQKDFPGIDFYIVGTNPSPEIEKMAQKDSSITVTGYVEELYPYLLNTTVYVCPLNLSGGIKNKILEAMAVGLPIVSLKDSLAGITDGKNHKHYIAVNSVEELDQPIRMLLNTETKRNMIGNQARQLVEDNYTWDSTVSIVENYLRRSCGT